MRGSLFGLAVGDALGAPHEFKLRDSYEVTDEMEESHTFLDKGKPLPAGTTLGEYDRIYCQVIIM
jgi:ADP-ribosyl-[dinitrogen reductase] hydrolase